MGRGRVAGKRGADVLIRRVRTKWTSVKFYGAMNRASHETREAH